MDKSEAETPATSPGYESDNSDTNNQVEAVQEGDIIKNDGKYIYANTFSGLKIIDSNPANLQIVSTVAVPENTSISEMFLVDKKLIIIGQNNMLHIMNDTMDSKIMIWPPRQYDDRTNVLIYDIENIEKPKLEKEYLFDSALWHRIQTYLGGKRKDLNGQPIYGKYELVKILTDQALDSVKWLEEIGVEFDMNNVDMPVGAKWRRGHKPVKNEGYAFVSALHQFVKEHGGTILTDTPVKELLIEDGKVTGIIGEGRNGQKVTIHAKAVILASGGFGANTKMLKQYNTYWTEIEDDIKTSNSPAITGDGIKLGESAGADLVGMGFSQMMPVSDPNTGALFSGLQVPPANFVMVNQKGERFVNEYESRDVLTQAAIDNGGLFYLIADEEIKKTAYNTSQEKIDKQVAAGTLFRSETLAGLAEQINVDPAVLEATVAKYNSYVDAGKDPEFGKDVFDLKVEKAPFYATPRKPAVHHTMGGLKIDPQTHVLTKEDQIIEGLYAAGEVAGGIHAGNRLGGNSLTDIFTFGRIAGKTAVAEHLE